MKLKLMLVLVLFALTAAALCAWPTSPLPQCGETPACEAGCLVPVSDKCAQVASEAVNAGLAASCAVGSALGTCIPAP